MTAEPQTRQHLSESPLLFLLQGEKVSCTATSSSRRLKVSLLPLLWNIWRFSLQLQWFLRCLCHRQTF